MGPHHYPMTRFRSFTSKFFHSYVQLFRLPRVQWVLFWVTLVNRMGTMVLPFLTLYLTRARGPSPSYAGLILAMYGGVSILISPRAGKLGDRLGAGPVLLISLVGSAIFLLAMGLAQDLVWFCVFLFFWAVSSELFRPTAMAIVGQLTDDPIQKRYAFVLNRLAINLGMSIGPVVGGFLAERSFQTLFWVDSISTFLAAVVLFTLGRSYFFQKKLPLTVEEKAHAKSQKGPHALSFPAFFQISLAMLPIVIVFFQHESTLSLVMVKDLGYSESQFGMIFTINTLLIVLFEAPLIVNSEHIRHGALLAIGALCIALGFGSYMFVESLFAIGLTVACWTIGEMLLFPVAMAYVSDVTPKGREAEFMGHFSRVSGFAVVLGPILGMQTYEHLGSKTLWAACFVVGIFSAYLFFKLPDAKKRA